MLPVGRNAAQREARQCDENLEFAKGTDGRLPEGKSGRVRNQFRRPVLYPTELRARAAGKTLVY
jgi:hypothetical protein